MLVSPTGGFGQPYPIYMGGGQQSGSQGNGWDNGWWIILLFILLASGNWGGNNAGNGGGFGGGMPYVINNDGGYVQRGFDQAAVMSGVNGIQSGIQNLSTQLCGCCGDIQTSLCNGFAGVNSTVQNGFSQAEIANTCIKLASYYTILDHIVDEPEPSYSFASEPTQEVYSSKSEFGSIVRNIDYIELMKVMDEAMETIRVMTPKLYDAIMRKLTALQ